VSPLGPAAPFRGSLLASQAEWVCVRMRRTVPSILLALFSICAVGRNAAASVRDRGSVPSRATASRLIGRARPDAKLTMSVSLRMRAGDALQQLIASQQDPTSSNHHRWLTPLDFAARFGTPEPEYAALAAWLQQQGFAVRPWPNRLRLDFTGRVAQVERPFAVRMNVYRHSRGVALANEDAPALPDRFAGDIRHVRLNTFALAHPLLRVSGPRGVIDVMAPRDIHVAYNVNPLLQQNVDGSGQIIAVVARSNFLTTDVSTFQQRFGLSLHEPHRVFPGSDPGVGAPKGVCAGISNRQQLQSCVQGEEGEVVLDTEWAGALAPGATVLVDISDRDIDISFADIVNHHPDAKIVTMSFGACERLDPGDRALFSPMYAQAAAQGQTVLVATGDDGVDECQDGRGTSVSVLATDPNVIAVGGTALDPGFDTGGSASGYVSETVWNDQDGSTGGGVSTLVPKPAYQSAPGVPPDGFRDIPDVSLLASPLSAGYAIIFEGSIAIIGGTSAAAPAWAGIVALLNQATGADGSGALNSTLYALGRRQYGSGGAAVFHDITAGNNNFNGLLGITASPGYDLASGLGTPDVAALIAAATAPSCAGDCNGDGIVTVNELLVGVDLLLTGGSPGACLALDANKDGVITVGELITATNRVLNGC